MIHEPHTHIVEIMDGPLEDMVNDFRRHVIRDTYQRATLRQTRRPVQHTADWLQIGRNTVTRYLAKKDEN